MSDKRDLLLMEVNGGCCKYLDFVFSKNHFNKIIVNYKILHSSPLGDILLHTERLSRATFVAAKRVNPLTTFLCETTSHCYNRSFCFAGAITTNLFSLSQHTRHNMFVFHPRDYCFTIRINSKIKKRNYCSIIISY